MAAARAADPPLQHFQPPQASAVDAGGARAALTLGAGLAAGSLDAAGAGPGDDGLSVSNHPRTTPSPPRAAAATRHPGSAAGVAAAGAPPVSTVGTVAIAVVVALAAISLIPWPRRDGRRLTGRHVLLAGVVMCSGAMWLAPGDATTSTAPLTLRTIAPRPFAGAASSGAAPSNQAPAQAPGSRPQAFGWPGIEPAAAPPAAPAHPAAAPAPPSLWTRLVAIERDILDADHVAARAQPAADHPALRAEAAFYTEVAIDQASTDELLTAAAATRDADVIAAVGTDLAIVRADLDHQTAISRAEQELARVGQLSASQLSAIAAQAPLIAPEIGPVSQQFGPSPYGFEPPHRFGGTVYPHFHTGIDIAAPLGTPVHAAADGVVLIAGASTDGAGDLVGYGQYIVIAHPQGVVTLYGHLETLGVHAGDTVRQGEIVGQEGSTGNSTGPHLHFEVRADGSPIDPLPFVLTQLLTG